MSIFEKAISVLYSEPCKLSLELHHQENTNLQGKQERPGHCRPVSAPRPLPAAQPLLQARRCFPQNSLNSAISMETHQG